MRRCRDLDSRRDPRPEGEGRCRRRCDAGGMQRRGLRRDVLRCGVDATATMSDDAGCTRAQDEGKGNAESFARAGGHLTEEWVKAQNKSHKNTGGHTR